MKVLPVAGDPCRRHACTVCCQDTQMPLLPQDILHLSARGHDPDAFSIPAPPHAPESHRLRNVAGRCYFLGPTGCTVHEDRPAGCRLYPLVWDDQAKSPVRDEECPWRSEFTVAPRHEADLQRLVARLRTDR